MQDDLLCTVPHTYRKPVRLQIFSSPFVETICLPNSPSPSGGPITPPHVKKSACMTLLPHTRPIRCDQQYFHPFAPP